ncbi:MAG: Rrf2 family transcriptional regulator [Anaerolineales bacterium]|nr:Rrf2 family transcriptional regulator [Anaerolineales bacterium]
MKISKKSDYALRVLMTLVEYYGREPISIRELADRNAVPKRFLEHIMLDLKSQGWVSSLPGKSGGYILAQKPDDINMGEIVRHFDNLLAPINCVSINHYERCSQEAVCKFRRVFLDVRNETTRLMDNTSLADAFRGEPVRRQEVFDEVLIGGAGI